MKKRDQATGIGYEPEQPPASDPNPQGAVAIEPDRSRERDRRPHKERSEILPIVADVGIDVAEAASSNIVVSGVRAIGRGALRAGGEGLEALGSVAELGGEVLSGAADAVGSAGEGCAGCAAVIVAVPVGLSLFSYLMFF